MKRRTFEKPDQMTILNRLRQTTEPIHLRLHRHPLLVELLERPWAVTINGTKSYTKRPGVVLKMWPTDESPVF
jgi:hypothetical protein